MNTGVFDGFTEDINRFDLTTERLRIRRQNESDFDDVMAHETNTEIMRYIKDIDPDITVIEKFVRDSFQDWIAEDGKWAVLGVYLRNNDAFLGNIFVRFESMEFGRVEIGYRFHPEYHGHGYATESMKALTSWLWKEPKINKLLAYCVADNDASYRLMEKLGMQREGVLRQHSTLGGVWHDELVYGVLR